MELSILIHRSDPIHIRSIVNFLSKSSADITYELLIADKIQELDVSNLKDVCITEIDTSGYEIFLMNRLIQSSKGRYVLFLNKKTYITTNTLKDIALMITSYPNAGMFITGTKYNTTDNQSIYYDWSDTMKYFEQKDFVYLLRTHPIIDIETPVILNKATVLDLGGLQHHLGRLALWFLTLMCGFKNGACYLPLISFIKNEISNSISTNEVLEMINILKTKYSDFRGHFASSTVFSQFSSQIKDAVVNDKISFDIDTFLLCLVPLCKEGLQGYFKDKIFKDKARQ